MQATVLLKKISAPLLAAFIATLIFLTGPAQADELTKEERDYLTKNGEIVFISQTNYPPFEFIGQDGDHTGMCIELARWIATRFGFRARFMDTSFKQAQEAVLSGKADVLTSLFYSKKRDRKFDFTQMIFLVPASIFVKADRPDINGIEDLNGKTIAMQAGDYAQEFLESKNIKFKVAWTQNFSQAINLVIDGKADAVIGDEQIVLYHIYSNHLTKFIKKVGEPLYIGQNCMGVKQDQQVLQGVLNKGIALAKQTGTLDRINTTWLGVHYKASESSLYRYRYYLLAGVGLLVLLALLIWFWNLRLRTLVARRTRALARSEKIQQTILAKSPLGIALVKNRIIVWENEAMRTMLGYGPGELEGQDSIILFPSRDEYWLADSKITKTLREKDNTGVETRCKRKNGRTFDCLLHSSILDQNDKETSTIIIAQDITDRKNAENALITSEKKYRMLAENMNDVIWTIDSNFKITYCSPSIEKLRGFTSEEVIGKGMDFVLTPGSYQKVQEIINEIANKLSRGDRHIPPIFLEVEQPHKNGSTVWAEAIVNVIFDQDGNFSYLQGVTRDITERRKLESQLREAREMESLGTLAGGIAHEFNNILAVIMGFTEIALEESASCASLKLNLKQILNATQKAAKLVKQILEFSRNLAIELQLIDLDEVVGNSLNQLKQTIPDTVEIEFDMSPEIKIINGNIHYLEQVIYNLVSNALDAMPQGGKLIVNTGVVELDEEFCLRHLAFKMGHYALLTVSDTGQGMDKKTVQQVFDPFFTTKEIGKGTGLGLSSVYGLVSLHDGNILCQSELDEGTTFAIYLPLNKEPESTSNSEEKRDSEKNV